MNTHDQDDWIVCHTCYRKLYPKGGGQRVFNPTCQRCRLKELQDMYRNSPASVKASVVKTYERMREYSPELEPPEVFFAWRNNN